MDDSISAFLWEMIFVIMFGLAVVTSFRLYENSSYGNRGMQTAIENRYGIREVSGEPEDLTMQGSDVYYAVMGADIQTYLKTGGSTSEISDGKVGTTELRDALDFNAEYKEDYLTDSNGKVKGIIYTKV